MLLVLEHGAVPVLEYLDQAIKVLLLEPIELDDARRVALEDANLVALGRATPLGGADVRVVECECVAAAGGFPAEATLCEPALAALLGEVEVDVVEALAEEVEIAKLAGIFQLCCEMRDVGAEVTKRSSKVMLFPPSQVDQGLVFRMNLHCSHLAILKRLCATMSKYEMAKFDGGMVFEFFLSAVRG